MARWEPNTRGRLLHAAVELFAERGYETTTAAQIADRANVTRTTLFRHFADKREILFQGQDELVALAVDGVAAAPAGSAPFEVLRAGILPLCAVHTEDRREIRQRLVSVIPASPELRERAVFKRSAVTDALHGALADRLGNSRRAGVLADLGVRAYYDGYAAWLEAEEREALADVVGAELDAAESALVRLTFSTLAAAAPGP
ncbi:TetR family transcriptional regulator [Clavibacter lycopersici]|uniref:TetR family transcriptional regulator n=1 Tax=Clavibacter lycopersici TaxID=2301718 RepID=A0A399SX50_9MICO|nr:TetR/AcrR family transcriptional regulator [Clavibacter lycopersici]RIJ47284.1 TetR family transcriptional regulator [Clavibacter lycopersici]RIJ59413.1 TetR family transcriptional regulator [Clavibacter lycopersici]